MTVQLHRQLLVHRNVHFDGLCTAKDLTVCSLDDRMCVTQVDDTAGEDIH